MLFGTQTAKCILYAIQITRALHADGGQTRCKIRTFCTYSISQLVVTALVQEVWEQSATNVYINNSIYFPGGCVILKCSSFPLQHSAITAHFTQIYGGLPSAFSNTGNIYSTIYSKNCFIRNWIIRKTRLTGKLTKVKLTLQRP
jgi:hypothetical protein